MDDLFNLDDLIPFLGIDPSDEHLIEIYEEFRNTFIDNDFYLNGAKIQIDTRPSIEEGFEEFPHTFVKMITRGKKRKRCFDRKRANKIHWIKTILENKDSEFICDFQFKESNGRIRDYFWFKDGDFIVIMELIIPNYLMISCFHVDDGNNQNYYQRKYENRE